MAEQEVAQAAEPELVWPMEAMNTFVMQVREMNRRAWEAIWLLEGPDVPLADRGVAAVNLRAALIPFRELLPEGWETCGVCGAAIAKPEESVADVEAGTLCAECAEAAGDFAERE